MVSIVNPSSAWHQGQSFGRPVSPPGSWRVIVPIVNPPVISDMPQNLGIGFWGILHVSQVFQEPACLEAFGIEFVEVALDIGQVGTVHRKA